MTNDKTTAKTILEQLGGRKFILMSGATGLFTNGDDFCCSIGKNSSKANRLKIKLDKATDTYTMSFIKYYDGWMDRKNWIYHDSRVETIKTVDGLYFDQLPEVFTRETGLYLSFC